MKMAELKILGLGGVHDSVTSQPLGLNDTSNSSGGPFPNSQSDAQFKSPAVMPKDQFQKLMEMHKKSAENAGIYVAVVLAVYVVLLSLLLCRYVRRRPTTRELPSLTAPPPSASPLALLASCPLNCLHHSVALLSALRHCSFSRGGAGVSSLSSDSKDDPDDIRRHSKSRAGSAVSTTLQLQQPHLPLRSQGASLQSPQPTEHEPV